MSINLKNITSNFSTGIINDNFRKLEEYINDNLLNRDGIETGEANQMELPLDMNSNPILNAVTDEENPRSLLTVESGDARYLNKSGGTMQGSLNMAGHPLFVREAVNGNEPARKDELDRADRQIRRDFQAADTRLQEQFRSFVVSSGYRFVGDYAAGIRLTEYNQLVRDENGEFWSVSGQVDLPYVTTGAGIPEGGALVPAGDAVLRQGLALEEGSGLVGFIQPSIDAVARTSLEKMRDTVNVKDFGAVPNDIAFADLNEAAFYKALSYGKPVVMDDTYYVRVNAAREMDVDLIHLTSEATENKIIFTPDSSGIWLNIVRCKSIEFNGCGLSNPLENSSQVSLIHLPETVYVDEVVFKGNKLNGRVRACTSSFNPEIYPANKAYGVGRFSVVDNEAVDVLTSCFRLTNMPCDMLIVKGNAVGNFLGTFITSGITSTATYRNDLHEAKAFLICADNVVVWDDDYFAPPFAGSYLAFLLFEGSYMEERNNHFEGIKTRDAVSTYDTYYNGGTLVSSGNTVKNVMCFNSNKQNGELLKSKGVANRHYLNNHYIVEEDFILRHGGSYENNDSWVWISNQSGNARMFECVDNTFDIFHLQGRYNSEPTLNVSFKRNTFRCVNYGGYLAGPRSYLDGYDYRGAVVEVEDNSIVTRYIRSHHGSAGFLFSTGGSGDAENAYRLISIKRNTLTETGSLPTPEEHDNAFVMTTAASGYAHTRRLETAGNKIITNNSGSVPIASSILYGVSNTANIIDTFSADGDEKSTLGSIRFNLTPFSLTDCPKVLVKNKISGLFPDDPLIYSSIYRPASGSRLVRLTLKGTFGGVPIGGTISCTISQTEIHFINSNGDPDSHPIVDGASTLNVYPKIYGLESEGFGPFPEIRFRYYTGANNVHYLRPQAARNDLIGKSGWMEMTLETQDFD